MPIREAHFFEAEVLSKLAFESKAYWDYSSEFMALCRAELNVSTSQLNSNSTAYSVCEKSGLILGFYAIERITKTEAELIALFVLPKFIGTGIGKQLMQHAIKLAKENHYTSLKIVSDPNAEKFYRAMGAVFMGFESSNSIKSRMLLVFILHL
ncbi:acetyltransferase (GNAT) family protein [Alteromonadaceae bacterium 2753L.S.0a.02]|nr:acetyltransferase (GNAT) family protein [Alteromonadaceae bacterium 2753L.S.0a.02]